MFNLENAIQSWKRNLRSNAAFEDGDIVELETHLKEEINRLREDGLSEERAFQQAVGELGEPGSIGDELYKTRATGIDASPPWKQKYPFSALLPNYFKTILRNIKRNPVYSLINILGLATGIACCMLILIYLQFQWSFDEFHKNSENLYRLNKIVTPKTGGTELHAISSGPMGPQMKQDFPEVKEFVRVLPWFDGDLISYENEHLKVDDFILADSTFFKVFDFNLLRGNPDKALVNPLSVVISEELADRFFKNENPIGKTVKGLFDQQYTVTGVIENPPEHSHLTYDVIISWTTTGPAAMNFSWLQSWLTQAVYTYLLLDDNAEPEVLESKLKPFMQQYFSERADQYTLYLQPFSDIYLKSTSIRFTDRIKTGNIKNVYIFSFSALLIFLIACINFINLTTARSMDRAREVGVRKTLGAGRYQLGGQFLGESLFLSLIALLLSFFLIQAGKPVLGYVNVPVGEGIIPGNQLLWVVFIGIGLVAGLLSGIYPAMVLSGFRPVNVLYGRAVKVFGNDKTMRKSLVVLQFSLSIILIVATLVIYRQMNFISNKSLGFQKEQILVIPIDAAGILKQAEAFKQELLEHSNIKEIAASNSLPGTGYMSYGVNPEGKEQDESWTVSILSLGDDDFLETYGLEMAEGRFFSKQYATDDSTAVVINEALVRSLGWDVDDAVGKRLDIPGEVPEGEVIGVVKDFHSTSLHKPIEPLILYMDDQWNFLSLRVEPEGLNQTLAYIEETWDRFESAYPFNYYFLDDRFQQFYTSELKLLRIAGGFTLIAIFVASLGLFGLSTYMVNQRTKEIGIRKILGSSIPGIVKLLSKEFLILVITGFLIAVPFSYWIALQWLQDFAYRIEIDIGLFTVAGIIALGLALIAVSYQSLRAALMDPVNSLRSE